MDKRSRYALGPVAGISINRFFRWFGSARQHQFLRYRPSDTRRFASIDLCDSPARRLRGPKDGHLGDDGRPTF